MQQLLSAGQPGDLALEFAELVPISAQIKFHVGDGQRCRQRVADECGTLARPTAQRGRRRCNRKQFDRSARARQQWKCLQVANAAANPKLLVTPPVNNATENFQSLDRDRFGCWQESQFGGTYIFCGERAEPQY